MAEPKRQIINVPILSAHNGISMSSHPGVRSTATLRAHEDDPLPGADKNASLPDTGGRDETAAKLDRVLEAITQLADRVGAMTKGPGDTTQKEEAGQSDNQPASGGAGNSEMPDKQWLEQQFKTLREDKQDDKPTVFGTDDSVMPDKQWFAQQFDKLEEAIKESGGYG